MKLKTYKKYGYSKLVPTRYRIDIDPVKNCVLVSYGCSEGMGYFYLTHDQIKEIVNLMNTKLYRNCYSRDLGLGAVHITTEQWEKLECTPDTKKKHCIWYNL